MQLWSLGSYLIITATDGLMTANTLHICHLKA